MKMLMLEVQWLLGETITSQVMMIAQQPFFQSFFEVIEPILNLGLEIENKVLDVCQCACL